MRIRRNEAYVWHLFFMLNPDITYFARTNFRNQNKLFGIRQNDRFFHFYVIGRTGTGKSTLLHTKIMQDIRHGRGCTLIDPHGDLVKKVLESVPPERKEDVIYFDVRNPKLNIGYNPFRKIHYEKRSLLTAGIISVFKHLFADAWGARIEHILRYCILALLDQPQADFTSLLYLLTDKNYRKSIVPNIISPEVKNFITKELPRYREDALAPVLNKVGTFLAYPSIKRILVENENQLSLRNVIDDNKILLVNLSKGMIGEDVAHIIGSILISSLALATFSRANIPEEERVPHFIYIDEFQHFTGSDFVAMLSELRKYKVGLILVHQFLDQLEPSIRNAILGNIGTVVSFRLGAKDAPFVAKEFYPTFSQDDLMNLPNYQIYLKMMIESKIGRGFSAKTVEPTSLRN